MEQLEVQKIKQNVFKTSLFAFFQSFLVVIPVIVPYWQKRGLSLEEIFLLQGLFGVSLMIFDMPAGYIADVFGRKKTLVIGAIITAAAYSLLPFGHSFKFFAVYEFLVGLGLSLQSGCDVAILYNSLEKIEEKVSSRSRFLGRFISARTFGEGGASLLGGLLAVVSLDLPAYVEAVVAWIPVLVSLSIYEVPGQKLARGSHVANICSIARAVFGHSKMLTLVIVSFIFYGFATYCATWSLQPYWGARGISYEWFGLLWAIQCFGIAIVSRYAHAIEARIGSCASIVVIALMPVLAYLGLAYTPGLWGLGFALGFSVCRGLNVVLFQDAINSRVPAEMRATTNSVGSLGMRALFLVFGPLLGRTLDHGGPNEAMAILGYVYLAGFFVVATPLLMQRRHFQKN